MPSQNAEDLIQKYQLNFKHLSGVYKIFLKQIFDYLIYLERNQY